MKLPFSFDLKFLFRVILPGFILSLGFVPFIEWAINYWSIQLKIEYFTAVFAIVFGWLFLICDMHIYMCIEGRRYWPAFLRKFAVRRKQQRLKKLWADLRSAYEESEKLTEGTAEHVQAYNKYIELSVKSRRYPVDSEGNRTIKFPTTLGNVIYAYENYPEVTYGMEAIFYYNRIWLKLDKDLRQHLDSQQGLADSTVYSTFALFGVGGLFAVYAFLAIWTSMFDGYSLTATVFGIISAGSLLLAIVVYKVSLQIHLSYGDLFKSIFDLHRDLVPIDSMYETVKSAVPGLDIFPVTEREKYDIVWRYFHNYRGQDMHSRVHHPIHRFQNERKQAQNSP